MLDPVTLVKTIGLLGISLIIFAESGLFFGFFLPGDTLLFAAGIFASQGYFPIALLIIVCSIAAIIGDNVGYWTGSTMGRGLFERETSFFFNKNRIHDAERFYNKHGSITIIAARFIPVIRTFAPIVAGVAKMRYKTFFAYNVIGGVLWATLVPLMGYYLATLIPNPDALLAPIVACVILISFLPMGMHALRKYIFGRSSKRETK
jgi:membrane-associated protein